MPQLPTEPLIALIAGVTIFIFPRLLNYIIALYLVVIGLFGLLNAQSSVRTADTVVSGYEAPVQKTL